MILKPANVVMLATDEPSNIYIKYDVLKIGSLVEGAKRQHLYFTTDEEIKEWCIYLPTGELCYQQFGNNAMYDKPNGKLLRVLTSTISYRKVVATTNPALWDNDKCPGRFNPKDYGHNNEQVCKEYCPQCKGIPKIPTSFIEKYVSEQGGIDKVKLEYNEIENNLAEFIFGDGTNVKTELKLIDNTVIVKTRLEWFLDKYPNPPVKQKIYSREEVLSIVNSCVERFGNMHCTYKSAEDWFNKNYPE